jgi:ribosomal protein S18 acetylase RimI-like enzyme
MSARHGGAVTTVAPIDLAARVDAALAVEAAAFGRAVEGFRRDAYLRHATYPGYAAVGVLDEDRLVGFGYGYTDAPGQWWHEQVADAMISTGHAEWLDGSWVLTELHVLPDYQGRHLGKRMLLDLLLARPEPRAMLSTEDTETTARGLYRRVGFVDLLTRFRFASTPRPFAVMGVTLPLGQVG